MIMRESRSKVGLLKSKKKFRDKLAVGGASGIKISGAPNDSFLLDPLKRYFRLSGEPLKLCRFISGRAIIFLSVRSF